VPSSGSRQAFIALPSLRGVERLATRQARRREASALTTTARRRELTSTRSDLCAHAVLSAQTWLSADRNRDLPGLGPVLVEAQGRTLYIFAPDRHSKVTCVSACATVSPPALLANGQKPLAAGRAVAARNRSRPGRWTGGHVRRLATVHLRHRHHVGTSQWAGAEPQRRPLVRDLAVRQGDQQEALTLLRLWRAPLEAVGRGDPSARSALAPPDHRCDDRLKSADMSAPAVASSMCSSPITCRQRAQEYLPLLLGQTRTLLSRTDAAGISLGCVRPGRLEHVHKRAFGVREARWGHKTDRIVAHDDQNADHTAPLSRRGPQPASSSGRSHAERPTLGGRKRRSQSHHCRSPDPVNTHRRR